MGKKPAWENVLLTDSGFFDPFDLARPLAPIVERFTQYEPIEDASSFHPIDWSSPPVMGVDVYKLDAVKIYQYDS